MLFIVCLTQQYDVKLSYAQLIKLHVSTPWGHLQAYKIQIIQDTSEVVTHNKRYRAPRSTHGHLDDIEHLPHTDATSPKPRAHTTHVRRKATGTS